jgi:hypothetical protein
MHGGVGGILWNFLSNRDASDAEIFSAAIVALDENADGVAPFFEFEFAR